MGSSFGQWLLRDAGSLHTRSGGRCVLIHGDVILDRLSTERSASQSPTSMRSIDWSHVIATIVAAAIIAWLAWPFYVAIQLISAMQKKDEARIAGMVDWPALKSGLKDDIQRFLLSDAQTSPEDEFEALRKGLVVALGPAIVNEMVDRHINPAGVALLFRGESPFSMDAAAHAEIDEVSFGPNNIKYAFFAGLLTFRIDLRGADDPVVEITALLRWRGSWKLFRIILPIDRINH